MRALPQVHCKDTAYSVNICVYVCVIAHGTHRERGAGLAPGAAVLIELAAPLRRGDGLVFDRGEPQDKEEGTVHTHTGTHTQTHTHTLNNLATT